MSFFNITRRRLCNGVVLSLMCTACTGLQAQVVEGNGIVVVVKRGIELTPLTTDQVARIFLGLNDTLPNGGTVIPVDAPESSVLYQDFYNKVLGKSVAQIKAYRARQSFTGAGIPPRQIASLAQTLKQDFAGHTVMTYTRKRELDDQWSIVLETGK